MLVWVIRTFSKGVSLILKRVSKIEYPYIDFCEKVKAVQDHEKLLRARIKARETPLTLVAALKKGEGIDLPCPQVLTSTDAEIIIYD